MTQIARETQQAVEALTAQLLADLPHKATAIDQISCEAIATAMVRARRLRAQGKDASTQVRMITRLLVASGYSSVPASPAMATTEEPVA
jgi:hypothetical protein